MAKKYPDQIICDGISILQRLDPISQLKSTVIINGIDTAELKRIKKYRIRIRQEFNIKTNAYVIGHVGRITPWKGQIKLLNAFIKYSKINLDAYLLLVGSALFDNDKYYQKIKDIISKNGLDARVIMPGYRSDLCAIFSAIDLFLYPSLEKDTSPLALLSAISSGLPVGVSNIASLVEIVDKCIQIDTFNPTKPDEMIALMKKYENDEFRKKSGMLNRESGIKYFDISIHGQKFQRIIEQNSIGI